VDGGGGRDLAGGMWKEEEVKTWLAACRLSDIEEGVEVMPATQYHEEPKMAKARKGGRRSRLIYIPNYLASIRGSVYRSIHMMVE
jgi:hypothetical protein